MKSYCELFLVAQNGMSYLNEEIASRGLNRKYLKIAVLRSAIFNVMVKKFS